MPWILCRKCDADSTDIHNVDIICEACEDRDYLAWLKEEDSSL